MVATAYMKLMAGCSSFLKRKALIYPEEPEMGEVFKSEKSSKDNARDMSSLVQATTRGVGASGKVMPLEIVPDARHAPG